MSSDRYGREPGDRQQWPGGAITVSASTATATTNSSANGTFGNGSSIITVAGNIHFGVEDDVDADSSSHGDSGGLVKISSFHSHANMTSVGR